MLAVDELAVVVVIMPGVVDLSTLLAVVEPTTFPAPGRAAPWRAGNKEELATLASMVSRLAVRFPADKPV
jgi:hypothetical protein